jgi:glutathione S-transferase
MYTLYWSPGSASMAPHGVLEELGQPFELRRIDLSAPREPDYLKLNPAGKVPTLGLGGGQAIYESAAICLFLADRHAEAGLAPAVADPQRAPFLQWLMFMTNTLQATYGCYFYPDKVTTDPTGGAGVAAKAKRDVAEHWARLDSALAGGPYLLGQRFSVADIFLHMLYTWDDPSDNLPARCKNVKRCAELVAARPGMQRMIKPNLV